MTVAYIRRTVSGIAIESGDILDNWPVDQIRKADIKLSRNDKLHRKAFAMLNMVYPHSNYNSMETLRKAMTIGAEYVDMIVNPLTGEVCYTPRSWGFQEMDDVEFGEFFNRLIDVALKIVPGTSRDDWEAVERELVSF